MNPADLGRQAAYEVEPLASLRSVRKAARATANTLPLDGQGKREFESAMLTTAKALAAEDQDDIDDLSEIAGFL